MHSEVTFHDLHCSLGWVGGSGVLWVWGIRPIQWRNDGVAAASSDRGPTGGRGPPTVLLEFLVFNFSVCLVLLSNCYIIIHCIVWFQVQPLMVVFQ